MTPPDPNAFAVTLTVEQFRAVVREEVCAALGAKAEDEMLTRPQVAALLQLHPKTITRLVRKGVLRGAWVGRVWRFRRKDITQYMGRIDVRRR